MEIHDEPRSRSRAHSLALLADLERDISAMQQRRINALMQIADAEERGDWCRAAELRARARAAAQGGARDGMGAPPIGRITRSDPAPPARLGAV